MPHDRRKMLRILDRVERQAIDQESMMDLSEEELLQRLQQEGQHQGVESRNISTTASTSGGSGTMQRRLSPRERDEIIRRAVEEEQREASHDDNMSPEDIASMERILDQEHQDLINRFQGVDLDQESFEGLWSRLNPEEQQEFRDRFMIPGRLDGAHEEQAHPHEEGSIHGASTDDNGQQEELEAKKLLQEMDETLKHGDTLAGNNGNSMLADLDAEDLRAIRDAEVSELIPIWRPWWEIEAEDAGQLKKVTISEAKDKDDTDRLRAASIVEDSANTNRASTRNTTGTVVERFVLDEEALLRPHRALVQDVEEARKEEEMRDSASRTVLPMTRAPHPSMIYHISALWFVYAATIRLLNGDLKEEPEQTLSYIFDLCPFFSPPLQQPSAPSPTTQPPSKTNRTAETSQVPDVNDFETTLAHLQSSSLNSKLWKGDTLRLEMLSLLLRDLVLILARPSRCIRSIRELKDVFSICMDASRRAKQRLYSKSALHRLFKKLEFYESYLISDEWIRSDRLDQLRTEVILTGIRVRQEMEGWTKDIGNVSRIPEAGAEASTDNAGSSKKILIEELS
ncbi:hypothetical protein BGX31_002460 [Mortierella sp. GBA43]|nr:hypothetical protein BGX31_002460 [Mortierella sp. GBA43]